MIASLWLLLALDAKRVSAAVRAPRAGVWLAVAVPAVLGAVALWLAGSEWVPDPATADGVLLFGMMASAPAALQAYPILFRPGDDAFVRRLGIPAQALFAERALRLLLLSLAVVLALLLPVAAGGRPLLGPAASGAAAALAGWSVSLWAHARAASRTGPGVRVSPAAKLLGPDAQLVAAGALVYAPLWALLAGAVAARFLTAPLWTPWLRALALVLPALALLPLAARRFGAAQPRFAPHAAELAFDPPADASGGELVLGRGVARVLPVRAQAVRARDVLVLGRHYRGLRRMGWPLAIICGLALMRGGAHPAVRSGAALVAAALFAAQLTVVVAIGRSERGRTRWLDRGLGLRTPDRLLGRGSAAFGMTLGTALPPALGWWLGAGSGGWVWIAAALCTAVTAACASLLAAGR